MAIAIGQAAGLAGAGGIIAAALLLRLPSVVSLLLGGVLGGIACFVVNEPDLSYAAPALGVVIGGASAAVAQRVLAPATVAGGSAGGVAAIAGGGGVAAGAISFVPAAGYAILLAAIWFAVRLRRSKDRKFAGLRVLR